MDLLFLLAFVAAIAAQWRKAQEHRQRVHFLAGYLRSYQIEKLMETLSTGYLRALGEKDPERAQSVWNTLALSEGQLEEQFKRFANELSGADEPSSRVSRLPIDLPFVRKWLPSTTFDLRRLMRIHAQGISSTLGNTRQLSQRDRAFQLCAEMFLMQHSCHWFCRSKTVASQRMLVRHKTHYAQLLAAVAPSTRTAYLRALAAGHST
jgi:hypothetical protein